MKPETAHRLRGPHTPAAAAAEPEVDVLAVGSAVMTARCMGAMDGVVGDVAVGLDAAE